MTYLEQILDNVKRTGVHSESWYMIRNVHFRCDDPRTAVEKWAEENGLSPVFDYEEKTAERATIRAVTFYPKDSAPNAQS
jgi:hypothetical protein